MELSKLEEKVIKWLRSVSEGGRCKIAFWAQAVFEAEKWEKRSSVSWSGSTVSSCPKK